MCPDCTFFDKSRAKRLKGRLHRNDGCAWSIVIKPYQFKQKGVVKEVEVTKAHVAAKREHYRNARLRGWIGPLGNIAGVRVRDGYDHNSVGQFVRLMKTAEVGVMRGGTVEKKSIARPFLTWVERSGCTTYGQTITVKRSEIKPRPVKHLIDVNDRPVVKEPTPLHASQWMRVYRVGRFRGKTYRDGLVTTWQWDDERGWCEVEREKEELKRMRLTYVGTPQHLEKVAEAIAGRLTNHEVRPEGEGPD